MFLGIFKSMMIALFFKKALESDVSYSCKILSFNRSIVAQTHQLSDIFVGYAISTYKLL